MLARVDPTLDRPVILFQDVIEILHGAVLAIVGQIACGLEHGNRGWISGRSRSWHRWSPPPGCGRSDRAPEQ